MLKLLQVLAGLVLALALPLGQAADEAAPVIAAAANLKFALPEIAAQYGREQGGEVELVFGSSGNFKTQIENGAPYEVYLSADEKYVLELWDEGFTADQGVVYAVGGLVLFVPHGSPLLATGDLADLKAALEDGRLRRFAIPNPEHAPYGRAARTVLQRAGLWRALQGKLVLGENAAQTAQFAASGASQGGIIPRSLASADEIARLGRYATIPAQWHGSEPLRQRMVLTVKAGSEARAFYRFMQSASARGILAHRGFMLPPPSRSGGE